MYIGAVKDDPTLLKDLARHDPASPILPPRGVVATPPSQVPLRSRVSSHVRTPAPLGKLPRQPKGVPNLQAAAEPAVPAATGMSLEKSSPYNEFRIALSIYLLFDFRCRLKHSRRSCIFRRHAACEDERNAGQNRAR